MAYRKLQLIAQEVDTRGDATLWALPAGAITRLGRGMVQDIAFSPDGKTLAVGSRIGLWLYDLSTPPPVVPIALWDTGRGVVTAVAFSPNGELLATGNWDGDVKVWDIESQQCVAKMKRVGRFDAASQLGFSPDGHRLASSGGGYDAVYIWHPETGEQVAKFTVENALERGPRPFIIPLAFSPDGNLLAVATPENTLTIWDIEGRDDIVCLSGHTGPVIAVAFSPCGRFVASGDREGTLREWQLSAIEPVRVTTEYANYSVIPAYAPGGTLLAAGCSNTTVAVWDVTQGETLDMFEHQGSPTVIRFSNGTHLAAASPVDFKVWRAENSDAISTISGHSAYPFSLMFSPDGRTLASADSGSVTGWDVENRQCQQTTSWAKMVLHAMHIFPNDCMRVLGTQGNTLTVWQVETDSAGIAAAASETIASFTEYKRKVVKAAFAPTGEFWASADIKGELDVWDSHGNRSVLLGHTAPIEDIAFAPDEKRIATVARDATARVWDIERGILIVSLPLTPPFDTRLYKGDARKIHRALTALSNTEKPRNKEIKAITFSPCGALIAGGLEGEIRLWHASNYETHSVILLPRACRRQFALAFSPCGRYLASGAWWWHTEKVSIRLWEVATGENLATFWGHPTDVQALAFSPDGALLASASFDGTILLWDVKPYLHNETS